MLDLAPTGPRPGFRELGISPRSVEEELSAMRKLTGLNRRKGRYQIEAVAKTRRAPKSLATAGIAAMVRNLAIAWWRRRLRLRGLSGLDC
jgi:hypothetical protein